MVLNFSSLLYSSKTRLLLFLIASIILYTDIENKGYINISINAEVAAVFISSLIVM